MAARGGGEGRRHSLPVPPAAWNVLAMALAVALLPVLAPGGAAAQPAPAAARVEQRGDRIVFQGRIDAASAAAFLRLLPDPQVTRLVITSPGGLVDAALDMAEALHARGLDIEVPSDCLSSCANYLLPAARRKHLGHAHAVGWHGNMAHVLHLHATGQGQWDAAAMAQARALAQREAAFFARVGVDGFVCWFGKLPPHAVADFYSLSAADMARFGIAGVTVAEGVPADGAVPAPVPVRIVVDPAALAAARPPAPPPAAPPGER